MKFGLSKLPAFSKYWPLTSNLSYFSLFLLTPSSQESKPTPKPLVVRAQDSRLLAPSVQVNLAFAQR